MVHTAMRLLKIAPTQSLNCMRLSTCFHKNISETPTSVSTNNSFVNVSSEFSKLQNIPNKLVYFSGKWSPGQRRTSPPKVPVRQNSTDEPVPAVWTPRSAGSSPVVERKEFRPVNFESPVLGRRNKPRLEVSLIPSFIVLYRYQTYLRRRFKCRIF